MFWVNLGDESTKGLVNSYVEAAKQLISLIGVIQGLYFVAISFTALKQIVFQQDIPIRLLAGLIFILPVALWSLGLYYAIKVVMPGNRDPVYSRVPADVFNEWKAVCANKANSLKSAQTYTSYGIYLLVLIIFIYLVLIPSPGSDVIEVANLAKKT
jgi:hypothetical protein